MTDLPNDGSRTDEAIEAEAAAWLAEIDGGISEEAAAAFARWRKEDVRHEAAVARLEQTWQSLQQLSGFRPHASRHPDLDILKPRSRARGRMMPRLALVAVLAVMMSLGIARWSREPTETYSTAEAGYQHVLLRDGTVMELRAETAVDVRFDRQERRVQLRRGEAHFTVMKDPGRPFIVTAGDVAVRAVGTAFNVARSKDRIEVLVTEGRVKIESADAASHLAEKVVPSVQAGERVVVDLSEARTRDASSNPPSLLIEKLAPEQIREVMAWQGTRLVFYETPLADVVKEFNRHNAVQVVLEDPDLGSIPVGGSFRAENLDAFIRLLAAGNGIEVHRSGDRIALRRNPNDSTDR